MPDAPRRRRRRAPEADSASTPREVEHSQSASAAPVRSSGGSLLTQLLDNPHLPQVIPHLRPEVLQRVIDRCGLEDCGEIIVFATPAQLSAVFDIDLWRSEIAGRDEQLDPERFGTWLEVMVSQDVEFAARTLAALDPSLLSTALSSHISAFDLGTLERSFQTDDEITYRPIDRAVDNDLQVEIGGMRIVAKRPDAWDAIRDVLIALDAGHQAAFHALLRQCRSLSSAGWERDGLDNLLLATDQHAFEVSTGRLKRREQQGYVSPADARAFLQMARELRLDGDVPSGGNIAREFLTRSDDDESRGIDAEQVERSGTESAVKADPSADEDTSTEYVAGVLDVLRADGLLPQPPRALLQAPESDDDHLRAIHRYLRTAHARGDEVYARRVHELTLLANMLVAGCPLRAGRFTAQQASDAAIAACNLGLEHWPGRWPSTATDDFSLEQDLMGVFQVGWNVLYREVCLPAADALVTALDTLSSGDTDLQADLVSTRKLVKRHLRAGKPWIAAESLDVVMSLDMCAWAVLVGLIAECPVVHEAIDVVRGHAPKRIEAGAFRFIGEDAQLDVVHEFLRLLTPLLRAA